MKPSYDAQDHARGGERYHTSEGIERGLDRVRARARTLMSFDEYCTQVQGRDAHERATAMKRGAR